MDAEKMAELVGQKHHVRLDQHDPMFMLVTVNEAMQKEAIASLTKIVTDASDQIATAAVLAENAAHARGERLLSAGAKMGSEQIQAAGDAATRRVVSEVKELLEQVEAVRHEAQVMVRVSWAAAAVSVLAVVTLISWQFWGPA